MTTRTLHRYIICWLSPVLFLAACNHHSQKTHQEIFTVEEKSITHQLYFHSIIEPAKVINLSTPVAGNLKELNFSYGESVKKDQLLLSVESKELKEKYQEALTQFIEKKEAWKVSQLKFQGTERLNKVGIITANDYHAEENANNDAYIAFLQAKWKLKEIMKLLGKKTELKKLIFSAEPLKKEDLYEVLSAQTDTYQLYAPEDGVALIPLNTQSGGNTNTPPSSSLTLGNAVKADEILITLGNLDKLRLSFQINEIDLSKLTLHQNVQITSLAFPHETLSGVITKISTQASSASGQQQPTFPVEVLIDNIPENLKSKIHIGMSAEIKITLATPPAIQIPLEALTEEDGNTYVTVLEGHSQTKRVVTPGETLESNVIILNGLKSGEKIVFFD